MKVAKRARVDKQSLRLSTPSELYIPFRAVIQIYTKVGPLNRVAAGDFRLHFCIL